MWRRACRSMVRPHGRSRQRQPRRLVMDVTETAVAPSSDKSQAVFAMQERLAARARLDAVFVDVLLALLDVIKRHRITWGEYRAASDWLQLAGSQDHEI